MKAAQGSDQLLEQALKAMAGTDLPSLESQSAIPAIAKDAITLKKLAAIVRELETTHRLVRGDARDLHGVPNQSVHLVATSPPYWTLKTYPPTNGQLGQVPGYEDFLAELDRVWRECYRVLVPGGRLIVVVGDVCLSRRAHGKHAVVPLHAAIQERCRHLGFDNLAPIIWHKISNATYEVDNGTGGFLGKPYEPNCVIKNDIEFILMQRKAGAYRQPTLGMRVLSVIPAVEHRDWFQQIWRITGASTREHPAPFPLTLAERLIRMFSFVGDTVLDPFLGTGTTSVAAARWGRNSIGFEIDAGYFSLACRRLADAAGGMFSLAKITVEDGASVGVRSADGLSGQRVGEPGARYEVRPAPRPARRPRRTKS